MGSFEVLQAAACKSGGYRTAIHPHTGNSGNLTWSPEQRQNCKRFPGRNRNAGHRAEETGTAARSFGNGSFSRIRVNAVDQWWNVINNSMDLVEQLRRTSFRTTQR
ncbi:MAG: hypothetical protein R3C26_21245 [Calditrichia bacterium]